MNRRATLSTLLGRRPEAKAPMMVMSGLDPYSGPWEFEQASHLLRRTMFGPTYAQMKNAVDNGLETTVDTLLADQAFPDPPVNYFYQDDPNVAIGETWIDAPYSLDDPFLRVYRTASLRAWTVGLMVNQGVSILEKMVLFWHNHFATEYTVVNDPKFTYRYITSIRENALGNFREFVKVMTVDPTMLRYLNGNQNTAIAPNENYARELLELFTIGKGPLIAPGDYSNYTETDIAEMAKVLTGWRDVGFLNVNGNPVDSVFISPLHDTSSKQLSYHFDNATINNSGENEYANLIDVIFNQDEVARFISRKLYRYFVYYIIDDTVETNVIQPLAQILIDNNYNIKPALEALLKSQHFYDMLSMGCIIKNPVEFVASIFNQFEVPISTNLQQQYTAWATIAQYTPLMQMEYYNPPSVAGWKAYYQEPTFYRTWINSVTLNARMDASDIMATAGFQAAGEQVRIDVLGFILTIDNNLDPNSVIAEISQIMFPRPLSQNQLDFLKDALIPGLPDFEWTVEFGDYLVNPNDPDLAQSVENKLRNLFKVMLSMPEFHLF